VQAVVITLSERSIWRLCLKPFHGGPCVRLAGHPHLCTKNVRLAPAIDRDDGLIEEGTEHPATSFPNDGTFAIFPMPTDV
jgi:hypothetical protein